MSEHEVVTAYADTLLRETREELARADGKASILLAAGSVAVGVAGNALLAEDGWNPSDLTTWAATAWWAGAALTLVGLALLGAAVYPRVKVGYWFFSSRNANRPVRHQRDRPHYFADIAEHSSLESARSAIEAAASDGVDRTVEQAWALSHVVMRKYALTKAALWLYAAGVLLLGGAHVAG